MNHKERDERITACPRCGADAQWSFVDAKKSKVEVMCSNCGRFVMARVEFDQAAAENVETSES